LVNPAWQGPAIWFQQMDQPRTQRHRIHLDITVRHDEADARVQAAREAAHRRAFQGRGYGAATLDALIGYLGTRPGADVLFTSCADGPGSPRGFYLRGGFIDTGRIMWGENLLALDLR
jgi:GNAT superfamily N-acetyltransferase